LLEEGIGVGVLGVEIGENFGGFFVAEPGVVVDAAVTVEDGFDGFATGDRRL
jgi:hypothetical protein